MVELYIYYQVRDEHALLLAPHIHALQARLLASHGCRGRLLRRPQATDGLHTWMEVYAVPEEHADFDAALGAAVDEAALSALIEGKRHLEVFTEIRPCA